MKKVFVALFLVASLFVVSLSVFAHDASHSSGSVKVMYLYLMEKSTLYILQVTARLIWLRMELCY